MRQLPYAAALAAALAVTTPAAASGCPLVTDPAGDAVVATFGTYVDDLDIRSVDLASGPTAVVAVIRLAALDGGDLATASGAQWTVGWQVAGVAHSAGVVRDPLGRYGRTKVRGGDSTVPYTVTADPGTATLTLTVPRSVYPSLATPGQTFTSIFASSQARVAAPAYVGNYAADVAPGAGVTYVDQSPGCVPAA